MTSKFRIQNRLSTFHRGSNVSDDRMAPDEDMAADRLNAGAQQMVMWSWEGYFNFESETIHCMTALSRDCWCTIT